MSGNKLFLDSNIVLYFLEGNAEIQQAIEDKDILISFISELELLSYPKISKKDEQNIKGFISASQLIHITEEIKDITIDFKRKYNIKLADGIIAASAFYFNIPLFTADSDFAKIEELDVIMYEI